MADRENTTITALERKICASKGVLSRALNNNSDVQAKWIQAIVENYPRYSAEWLLTGKGEMLRDGIYSNVGASTERPKSTEESKPAEVMSVDLKLILDRYERLAGRAAMLEAAVERLTTENEELKKMVEGMDDRYESPWPRLKGAVVMGPDVAVKRRTVEIEDLNKPVERVPDKDKLWMRGTVVAESEAEYKKSKA
jgi:predicted RNase H-like nuclease (RuvC/YqgF family)